MIKNKGIRDIQTMCGLAHRAATGTRRRALNELAYLEHAKEQLERELGVWTTNQKRVGSRLQLVRQRIALLQRILVGRMEPSAKCCAPPPDQEAEDHPQEAGPPWREVTLEY